MNLKLRPISEAPLKENILVKKRTTDTWVTLSMVHESSRWEWQGYYEGFILVSDLLRAAEILAEITPEGMAYFEHDTERVSQDRSVASRMIYFRRLAPPVKYEWIAEQTVREIKPGDWWWCDHRRNWQLAESDKNGIGLCARRVEAKK
jgi:hypothetical protein